MRIKDKARFIICGWKHEGEALKLMGETNDEP